MLQVARNLIDNGTAALVGKRHLMVDRDTKYSSAFRAFLAREGVEVISLPPRSPNLNAYAERFVKSIKSECVSKLIPIGAPMLRRALREYTDHYHLERNHQGLDNQLIIPTPVRCSKVQRIDLSISPRRHAAVLRTCRGMNALEFSNNTSRSLLFRH
jgi:transposase InsO family protein